MTAHGETAAYTAGLATVVTSVASALSNLPVINRVAGNAEMTRSLAVKSLAVVLAGVAALVVQYRFLNER